MDWDLMQLKEICNNKNIKYPQERINYIGDKISRYYFVRDHFPDTYKIYFDENKKYQLIDNNIILLNYTYSNLLELTSTLICSIFDILGFILNTLLLNDSIKERDVSLNTVLKELKKKKIFVNIINKIEDFQKLYSYKYITSFNNIIKHRGIVRHVNKLGVTENFIKDLSIPFINEFKYNNIEYDECSAIKFFEFGDECIENIMNIGNLLNINL